MGSSGSVSTLLLGVFSKTTPAHECLGIRPASSAPVVQNRPVDEKVFTLMQNKKLKKVVFTRREAVGICLSLEQLINSLANTSAAAAEEAECALTVVPSGLAFCDKVIGTGPRADKGQLIKANYVGKLENGNVFDSSYSRGRPLTFRVGVGEVIKGWDQGILGSEGVPPMLAGGKRILKLPPQLGYGTRGAGCKGGSCIIPPNAVLLFDVEFIGKA